MLILGDIILDHFIHGSVTRISPEAPVPIVNQKSVDYFPGGAANVARNLAALGGTVVLIGIVGRDDEGEKLLSLMRSCGVNVDDVHIVDSRPTCHKTRIIGDQQHIVRIDREVTDPISEETKNSVLDAVQRHLPNALGIVCSDYNKGFLSATLLQGVIREAAVATKPVFVDPKGHDYTRYTGVTVLTPNLMELHIATGLRTDEPELLDRAAAQLLLLTKAEALLVTCGRNGLILYEGELKTEIATETHTVMSVSGAGDSVIAAFSWAMVSGKSIIEAARLSNLAGSISVSKPGTSIITRTELEVEGVSESGSNISNKILDLRDVLLRVSIARQTRGRIVFTNGCFDLLHVGHVEYLQKAKALGDLLIVGLNADSSVRTLKGDKRPIVSASQRSQLLAALDCVNFVVIFAECTPLALIHAIMPDILVKGGDYQLHQVVGRDIVEAHGGRVVLIPVTEGLSTTAVVNRIIERYQSV